ncbi:MAG: tRNA lysidine(34) synthetase TilS, partial [Cyclobacteriaceae bacterium]|nr:tRNA lysidine(34) synthetase TilS [Cyclobacteriaceae bacterium]
SGGLDSMVMAHLFKEAGYSVGIAHCNFQLRGSESDEDELFVKNHCAVANIPFFSKRFDTNNYAEANQLSTQMAARELRYAWFSEILESKKYHWLATAHHLNDNLETVMLAWTKGTDLHHLTGIPVQNEKVIRPLLFATRDEIVQYAHGNNVSWREDSSNASSDYQRNFIRHEVVPKLKQINPSLEETFSTSLEKLKGASEQMQRGLGQLRDSIVQTEGRNLIIDKNLLLLLKHPAFFCFELLHPLGFEWQRCVQMVEAIHGQPGKKFLSSSHEAVVDRDHILVVPRGAEWNDEVLIEEGQDQAAIGPWQLSISRLTGKTISEESNVATLDLAKLKFPLLWRKWRPGDSFVPLGSRHHKKISDLLVDEKVPMTDKAHVTLLLSGREVAWVVGHRVAEPFKVSGSTKAVLCLRLRQR